MTEPSSAQGRCLSPGLLLALAAGLLLRLCGLSHDLHAGFHYHPDVPKQVRAVQRYLDGKYYHHTGLSDYDGYPLFHAHLTEYLCRGYQLAAQGTCDLLGLERHVAQPSLTAIHWTMRLLNVALSTLAILLVFRIAVPLAGRGAGLLGAWLMALSPADIAGAHYAAGDPAAAFFALWAVERALAVWRDGRTRDYLLAAIAAVCAFGAKYHAGMCLLPLALAHVLRQRSLRELLGRASWRRILLLIATCVIALFLVIPSMFERPGTVLQEIASFLGHVSSGSRLASELEQDSFASRFVFSLHRNAPVLLDILSWPVLAAGLAGLLFALRRDRGMAILVALPLVYFLLGVSLRPLAHPVYHVLMTGPAFALAAVLAARWAGSGRCLGLPASVLLAGWSLFSLAMAARREAWLFQRPDTRRVALQWARENLPARLPLVAGPYTFRIDEESDGERTGGCAVVSSSIRPLTAHQEDVPLARFALEARPLPFFRNPTLCVSLRDEPDVAARFHAPLWTTFPSGSGMELAFGDAPGFLRSARVMSLAPFVPARRWFVLSARPAEALAVVRSGQTPIHAELEFGRVSRTVEMGPGEVCALRFPRPAESGPAMETGHVFQAKATVGPGPAQVTWAFAEADEGRALFGAGLMAEAAGPLSSASAADPADPLLAALACLAGRAAPGARPSDEAVARRARPFDVAWDEARVRSVFGVAPAFLESLPALGWSAADLISVGARMDADEGEVDDSLPARASVSTSWWMATPAFNLDIGVYRLDLRYTAPGPDGADAVVAVHDFAGAVAATGTLTSMQAGAGEWHQTLALPRGLVGGRVIIQGAGPGWRVLDVAVRPEIVGSLDAIGTAWRCASRSPGTEDQADPFAALASPLRGGGAPPRALHARFPLDLELVGFRLREPAVSRGDSLGLNLYWGVNGFARQARNLAVWVHFLDASGKTSFQGDHRLADNWHRPRQVGEGGGPTCRSRSPRMRSPGATASSSACMTASAGGVYVSRRRVPLNRIMASCCP